MRNILTIQVESYTGAVFIALLAAFFAGLIFLSIKNFNSDIVILASEQVQVKTISARERVLLQSWIKENDIKIPPKEGYKYLIGKYPSRPWLK